MSLWWVWYTELFKKSHHHCPSDAPSKRWIFVWFWSFTLNLDVKISCSLLVQTGRKPRCKFLTNFSFFSSATVHNFLYQFRNWQNASDLARNINSLYRQTIFAWEENHKAAIQSYIDYKNSKKINEQKLIYVYTFQLRIDLWLPT